MKQALSHLPGTHDFSNFAKVDPSKGVEYSTVRTITSARLLFCLKKNERDLREYTHGEDGGKYAMGDDLGDGSDDEGMYIIEITGSAFLWHMVRCIVGIIVAVGRGLEDPSIVRDLLSEASATDTTTSPEEASQRPARRGRPAYSMAPDVGLALVGCTYPSNLVDFSQSWRRYMFDFGDGGGDGGSLARLSRPLVNATKDLWKLSRDLRIQSHLVAKVLSAFPRHDVFGGTESVRDEVLGDVFGEKRGGGGRYVKILERSRCETQVERAGKRMRKMELKDSKE
jgi:hypothetical protein